MALANAGSIRIAGFVLVGGVVTGMLLAMAMPTQMKRKAENWRELIGVHDIAPSDDDIAFYAPPQDLDPVHWQTAAQEYPGSGRATSLDLIYPHSDVGYQPESDPEPLPPELTQADDADLAAVDDDAASAAQAASAAAQDVQAQVQAPDSTSAAPVAATAPEATGAA